MVSAIDSALAGLAVFKKKMDVSANNIANVSTEGFKKSRVIAVEGETGNPQGRAEKVNTPGVPLSAIGPGFAGETSNVDLATEMVTTMMSQKGYIAQLKTIENEKEALDTLLDTFG